MTRPPPKFEINERAEANEGGPELVKVVNLKFENDQWHYLVRAFNHPHEIYWVDDYHIDKLQEKWHHEQWHTEPNASNRLKPRKDK